MESFRHGGNIYKAAKLYNLPRDEIIDLSANINPLGVPDTFKEVLFNRWDDIKNYPDPEYTELIKAIADYEELPVHSIVVGNGATEVIYEIIRILNPKKSLILAPTFGEYERALNRVKCDVDYHYLKEENDFNIDKGLLQALEESDTDAVILCNPNNPTSQLADKNLMHQILDLCREKSMAVVIDEAFIDFVDEPNEESMKLYLDRYKNLYIIKALTKFFAIPGLRIGYAISSNWEILNKIKEEKLPWTINSFAALAGETILADGDYIRHSKEWIREERSYFFRELSKINGIKAFLPKANYILFKVKNEGTNLQNAMMEHKILIRSCSNYQNLSEAFYRVAIKDRASTNYFLRVLKEVLYEG